MYPIRTYLPRQRTETKRPPRFDRTAYSAESPSVLSTKAQEQAKKSNDKIGSDRTKPRSGNYPRPPSCAYAIPSGTIYLKSLAFASRTCDRPTAGSSSHGKSVQHNAFAHEHTEKRPASSPRTGFPPIRFRAAVSPKPRPNEAYPRSTARPSIRALGSHTRYRPRSSRCRRSGGRRSCAAHARR